MCLFVFYLFCLKLGTKSFLTLGHILVLTVSLKFLNLGSYIAVKAYTERACLSYNKQNMPIRVKF